MADELDLPETISLKCLFCGGEQFEIDDSKEIGPGDMVKCSGCGEQNSYEGMLEVCEEEATDLVKSEVERMIKASFKDTF